MGIHYYLKDQMETKRSEMIQSAKVHGLASQETVRHSQELDHLMNLYRKLTVRKNTYTSKVSEPIGYMN
ncbi:aspartyl-phosphate phosphatase Spo0E family protein [Evansella sp. AB-P1]|uniref:aspartyl-phosphate phosphatase Spo0E family protein n=1 Tax=Evansella sp. AB-P1 TaxID=3037653 RepID=UPI00241CF660|nr:aspartyl-phosphate phosphatase Spo0E family protein [Evansella sp. AB-P1]MDG5786303.1 aspartyl-phosphate phosphatase Spo0E family protein [Evansella sp. AB-P1]